MALAVILATVFWSATPVGQTAVAQSDGEVYELHYEPLEGPPGTIITITGTCRRGGRPADDAYVRMFDTARTHYAAEVQIPVRPDGSVNGTMQVAEGEPAGDYTIAGDCFIDDFGLGPSIEAPFSVTEPVVVTTTSPTEPPTTTTPATEPATATTTAPTTTTTTAPPTTATTSTTVPATTTAPPTTEAASGAPPDPGDDGGTSVAIPALAGAAALAAAGGAAWRLRRSRVQS